MIKKLKDLTFNDYTEICKKQQSCFKCPLRDYCGCCLGAMQNIEDDKEKEIQV